jgi:hypothetical protein
MRFFIFRGGPLFIIFKMSEDYNFIIQKIEALEKVVAQLDPQLINRQYGELANSQNIISEI